MTEVETKLCRSCGIEKPVTDFYKDGKRNGKVCYRADCKDCYKSTRMLNAARKSGGGKDEGKTYMPPPATE